MFHLHLSSELQHPVGAVSRGAEPTPGPRPMLGLCRFICISKGATSTLLHQVQTCGPQKSDRDQERQLGTATGQLGCILLSGPEAQPADSANLSCCPRHWRLRQGEKDLLHTSLPCCRPLTSCESSCSPLRAAGEERRGGRGPGPGTAMPMGCSTGL